jgi:hypothetical protein
VRVGALREELSSIEESQNAGAMTTYFLSGWLNSGDVKFNLHVRVAIQRYVALKYTIAWITMGKRSHTTYEEG